MRDYEFYVSGALRPILAAEGWRIEAVANGRWTCELDIASMDGTFHAAIGDDVWPAEKVGIVSAAAGTPSVLTTDEPHGCVTGQLVTVGGNPAIAPGTYRVTVRSPTTVSIPVTAAGPASGGTLMRRIFGGEITTPTTAGFGGAPWAPTTVQIQAGDYSQRFERRYLNTTIPAGTLKSQLAVLATAVPGVALHPFQVDGPAMPQITLTYTLIRDVLNQLSVAAGDWPWELDEYVFLRMWAPGTDVCPINLIEGDGHALGDIAVYPTRDQYANRVLLRFSDVAHAAYAFLGATAQFADGDQVVIGSTTYTFKAAPAAANDVGIGPGVVDSLNNLVAGIVTGATGGSPDTQVTAYVMPGADAGQGGVKTIALEAGAAGNSIGVSTTAVTARWFGEGNIPLSTLALGADQALTNVAIAADPSSVNDPWEALVEAPDVTSLDDATPLAAAYLQSKFIEPRIVTFKTLALGLRPGQALTITLPSRGVNNTFLITQVNTTCQNVQLVNGTWEQYVIREVTAVEALALHAADRWRALYQQWSKTAPAQSGAATSIASPGGGGGGGGMAGTGTPGRIVKWTSGPALADAALFEAGGNIGLNTVTPGTFQGGGGSTGTVFQVSSVTSHAQFVASAHNPGALAAMNFEVGDAMAGRRVIQQFYHGPTNALRWRVLNETNGAVVMSDLLALSNAGNVGIGTATPSDGGLGAGLPSLMVQGASVRANLVLSNSNAAVGDPVGSVVFSNFGTTRVAQIDALADGATNSGSLQLFTFNAGASVAAVRIRANGNVGIGTFTPSYRLHVVSGGGGVISQVQGVTNPRFNVSDGAVTADVYVVSGTAQFGSVTITPVNINTNDTVAIHVDTSQRVGLGTTAPLTFQLELTADVGPHTPFSGNIGHLTQKWASVYAGELHVETLVAQQTITTISGRAVIASGGNVVTALVGVPDGFIFFKYNSLKTGDVIVFEGPDATGAYSTEFMQVIGAPTGAGPFLYQVTRNYGGAFTAHSWPAGAACMNTGQTGAGFIDLYSINSLKGPSEVGPTIVGNLRTSNAYNDWNVRWAIGNLNGLYGYTTNLFGVAIGVPAGTNITIEASNGIQIRSGTVPVFVVDTSGNLGLAGNLTMSTNGIFKAGASAFTTGTGWWLDYNSGTPRFRVGNPSGDQIAWDGLNLSVRASNLTVDTTGVTVAVTTAYQAARAYRFSTGFGSTNNFGLFGLETGTTRQLTLQNTTGVGNNVWVSLLAQNGNGYFAQLNLVAGSTSTSAALQSSYIQLVGNVGVNTQTASSVPLTVYNLATGWAMAITAGVFNGAGLYIAAGQSSQEIIQAWFQANVTTLQGIVYGDGNWLKNNSSVWSILSDRTIKKNVVPLTGALDRIRRVQLHEFEYNGVAGTLTDEHGVGVIAQDIQPIFPRSVTTVQIPNIHNPLRKTTALGFNAHELFMNGIGAIIELDARVAALTARLAALEQR